MLALAAVGLGTLASAHWDPVAGIWSPYPVHLDEYFHWGFARASVDQGTVGVGDPFTGGARRHVELASDLHERGFQAFLGAFQQATAISWLDIFTFGPLALILLLMLCVFALLEPFGAGVEGALLLGFVPTTLRFLGPGFLVPITFAMPLVFAGLWLLVHGRSTAAVALLGIVAAALWPVHAMAALLLSAVTLVWLLTSGRLISARLASGLVVAVSFVAAWPYYGQLLRGDPSAGAWLPLDLEFVRAMGLFPLVLVTAGAFLAPLVLGGERRALHVTFILVTIAMLGVVLGRAVTGGVRFNLYDRTVTTLPTFVAIAGALGLAALASLLARVTRPQIAQAARVVVCLAIAGVLFHATLTTPREDRYQVLDDAHYDAYVAAAQLLPNDGSLALVDGISTMAFTAITGHPTVYVQDPSAGSQPPELTRFFREGSADTQLLIASRVSIVVTDKPVLNPNLRAIAPGVYVVDLNSESAG